MLLCKHFASLVDNGCIKAWCIILDMYSNICLGLHQEDISVLQRVGCSFEEVTGIVNVTHLNLSLKCLKESFLLFQEIHLGKHS